MGERLNRAKIKYMYTELHSECYIPILQAGAGGGLGGSGVGLNSISLDTFRCCTNKQLQYLLFLFKPGGSVELKLFPDRLSHQCLENKKTKNKTKKTLLAF